MTNVVQFTPRGSQPATKVVPLSKPGVHYMVVQYVIDAARAYSVLKDDYDNMQILLAACITADPLTMVCAMDDTQWDLYKDALEN